MSGASSSGAGGGVDMRGGAGEAPDPAAKGRDRRGGLALTLLSGGLGAALILLSAGRVWAHGGIGGPRGQAGLTAIQPSGQTLRVEGGEVTGVPTSLALFGLACLVAIFAVRRMGRRVVSVMLALSGLGAAIAAGLGAFDRGALHEAAAQSTGLTGATAVGVTHNGWPWVAAVGGVALLAAGVNAVVRGQEWPGLSSRYEAPVAGRAGPGRSAGPVDPDRPEDLWKALDRGEDPTDDAD